MNYKIKIVVDEMCEVGTTARKVTYDTVVTLKKQDGLDRQIYTIETESSDGLGHVGEIVYRGFSKPNSVSIENLAQLYIENNLVENSFDNFLYNH
jgi:hypothetical protein